MKKKYLLPLVLTCAAAIALAACGGSNNDPVLDKKELTLCVGAQETLTLVLENKDGTTSAVGESVEYTWKSSNEDVVTVEAEGATATVTAVADGNAVVTVYDGKTELSKCTVTVVTSPLSVTVPEGKLVVRNNTTVTVRAKSITALTGEYVWESSDPTIATVEAQGVIARVTAKKRGECTITVKNGIYSASFTFIVGLN